MKKVFAAFLILALLAGCVPAQAADDAAYVGTWIKRDTEGPVDLIIEIFHFSEDHRAYYLYQAYYRGKPTTSYKYAGTWSQSENGIDIALSGPVEIKYHAIIEFKYASLSVTSEYSNIGNYFISVSNDMLSKLADEKLNALPTEAPAQEQESGVYVPGGYWEVGVDIPAGVYSVRRAANISSQNFVVYDAYNPESGRYTRVIINTILNERNPQIGKFTLYDGNIVWVDEGVYFDAPITLGF